VPFSLQDKDVIINGLSLLSQKIPEIAGVKVEIIPCFWNAVFYLVISSVDMFYKKIFPTKKTVFSYNTMCLSYLSEPV